MRLSLVGWEMCIRVSSGWAQIFFAEGGWKYAVMIVVACVLIVVFSKNIYFWLSNQLWKILLLAAVFGGGWLLGRFGGKKNGTQQGNGN